MAKGIPTRHGKKIKKKKGLIKPCKKCGTKVKTMKTRFKVWVIMCPKITNGCSDSRMVSGKTRAEVITNWNKVN